jgi:2'-5' RNA ligase
MNHKTEYGCLMAIIEKTQQSIILNTAKKLISNDILFTKPDDDSYGFDDEPHVTIKYGFTPDLNPDQVKNIIAGVKPFDITLVGLSFFKNPEFTVVKFDVNSDILHQLRKKADGYPNEDAYPVYHPHLTLAYVKPDSFEPNKQGMSIILKVNRFKYSSGTTGTAYYIDI